MEPHTRNTVVGIILPVFVVGLFVYPWYIYTFRICSKSTGTHCAVMADVIAVNLCFITDTLFPDNKAEGGIYEWVDEDWESNSPASYFHHNCVAVGSTCLIVLCSRSDSTVGKSCSRKWLWEFRAKGGGHWSEGLTSTRKQQVVNMSQGSSIPRYCYAPGLLDPKTQCPKISATAAEEGNAPNERTALLPTLCITRMDGMLRYCNICQCYKPDRTHHCKECNACILRMDQ